jgi:chromosome segregation protein
MERYGSEISEYQEELPEGFSQEKYSKDVQKIRALIENMGPINMMAIEEYETISSRESFISKQKDEVEAAASLLESAIDEIEENSEEKFLAAFHNLNREFQELFPILFPGGDGHLLLTNEQKALDGGIEIMVRLPGKKRQPMRLFSGGEKALTAIVLIFALLKSKPTPFCFLDEVDAPLDETNVGRYNRVLEALSERFQFIVITHNRRTMEVLDTLYGVTMQEPGVSKVVGVDMSKDIPAHLQKAFKETSAES